MDTELLKLLGGGGSLAALLALVYIVGQRLVKALDKLIEKIEEHTKDDVERHGVVMQRLEGMEVRIDTALDLTPVRPHARPKTSPRGIPVGYYAPRPGTHNDGED